MNELKGIFCGAAEQEWTDNRTGEVGGRPRISLNMDGAAGLPRLLECDRDVLRAAQSLRVGEAVVVITTMNRYNALVVKSVRAETPVGRSA